VRLVCGNMIWYLCLAMMECDPLLLVDMYMCYSAFVGYIYASYVVSCCCQNFKRFIKFLSCLKVVKFWFEFA
jgi:hypothetical protein